MRNANREPNLKSTRKKMNGVCNGEKAKKKCDCIPWYIPMWFSLDICTSKTELHPLLNFYPISLLPYTLLFIPIRCIELLRWHRISSPYALVPFSYFFFSFFHSIALKMKLSNYAHCAKCRQRNCMLCSVVYFMSTSKQRKNWKWFFLHNVQDKIAVATGCSEVL